MGNYQSVEIPEQSTSQVFEPVDGQSEEFPEQETKLYEDKVNYVVVHDDNFYNTDSLQNAKDYVNSLIDVDFAINIGDRIFVDTEEYDNIIIYRLTKVDPTSLFCKTSFYCNYKILFCKPLPEISLNTQKDN